MTRPPPLHLLIACLLIAGCNTRAQMPPAPVAPSVGALQPVAGLRVVGRSVDAASGMCRVHDLSATFDAPVDPASVHAHSFVLTDEGVRVPGRVSIDGTGRSVRFTPADPAGFQPSHTIVAVLLSGAPGVRGRTGEMLAHDHAWVFSTGWEECNSRGLITRATVTDLPRTEAAR